MSSAGVSRPAAWGDAVVLTLVGLIAVAFYFWTATSNSAAPRPPGPQTDYYNLLVRGFRSGHLYMDVVPDPALVAMPIEKRPGDRPYLLDASLHGDHYYLYFGVTPALTVFLPWAVLTGRELPCERAVAAQATLACWIGLAMLGVLRAEFFPRAGRLSLGVAALGFALATAAPLTLRKSEFYEAAITAGFLWGMAMLLCATLAVRRERRRTLWLACASLCAGLAVASRPNLLAGAVAVGAVLVWSAWRARRSAGESIRWRWLAAAVLPAAFCGMGLALYNTARFGDPLEFGHRFQVGSIADNYVSLRYFIHNLTVYYLTPPSVGWFFPFFSPGLEGARPPGYIGVEYADGQWWFLPWLVVLPVLGGIFWRRLRCVQPLAVIVGVIALWFAANFALVASVSARANRYMLDFHPALVLLVGLALLAWSGRGGGWRFAVGAGAVSVITAAFVNVMESLQVHEFFRQGNPAKYAAIERAANRLVWPLHRVTSPALGPIECVVTFPNVPAGTREPLVCTGAPMLTNTLSFFTLGPGRARLEFDHESHGGARGPEFTFEPGRPYDLKIWLGSLLPPVGHPWFDGVAPALVQQQKQTVMVQLDGRTVFVSSAIPHDASPGQVRLGRSVVQYSDAQPKFSGRIGQVHRGAGRPPLPGPAAPEEPLTYALEMLLPRDRFGLAEPLMATGRWGKGDVVLIEYSSPTSVRLGHDQLGGGIEWSEPLPVDYLAPLKLEISFETPATADRLAAVDRAGLRPVIHRGGQTVFAGKNVLHTFDPAQVSVGCNTAGASASRLYFAGTILAWEFVGDRVQRAVGGGVGDPDTCVEFVPPRALSATVAEPLLAYRNTAGDRAVLALRSAGPGLMQLGWREAATAVWSESFRATPGANVRLEVRRRAEATAGALATDGISAGAFFRGRAEIRWNGEPVFQPRLAFFDSPIAATAGWSSPSGVRGDLAPHFTGAIRVVEARSPPTATLPPHGPRTVRVSVRFPANRIGLSEPLLTSGRTGAADSVYVHYLAGGRISLGFDHWGAGGPVSAPLAVDYAQAHALEVTLGDGAWEQGGAGLLRVRLDGRRVIESRAQFHPARAGEIVLGENPVGLSTSVPEFSGMLNSLE